MYDFLQLNSSLRAERIDGCLPSNQKKRPSDVYYYTLSWLSVELHDWSIYMINTVDIYLLESLKE